MTDQERRASGLVRLKDLHARRRMRQKKGLSVRALEDKIDALRASVEKL